MCFRIRPADGGPAVLIARIVFVCASLVLGVAAAQDDKRTANQVTTKVSPRDQVAAYLDWLPADTESLVVAQGPFRVPQKLPVEENKDASFESLFCAIALSPLVWVNHEKYLAPIAGQTVITSVEGIKDFRGDPMRVHKEYSYSGCHVLVFQRDLGDAGDALWKLLQTDASRQLSLEGLPVVVLETSEEKPLPKRLLIARPRNNILLCATEEGILRDVVERIVNNRKSNALPATLPEWKQLDSHPSYWALRHYDRDKAQSDPSSPLRIKPQSGKINDADALGVVLMFEPNPQKVARYSYLSGDVERADRALKTMSGNLPALGVNSSKVIFRNCPEILVDVSSPEAARVALGVFLSMWAHQGWLWDLGL